MPNPDEAANRINASPTKEFFIHMLVRDIPLNRSVLDLVDNSVDGAQRMRDGSSFEGLWIRLEINPSHFRIADNCGGIPVDVARDYAFRFGRPNDAPSLDHSIGQFGVGMKRTFFKLGQRFSVESATQTSRIVVQINVEEWKRRQSAEGAEDWHFEFADLEENVSIPEECRGTTIEINELHPSVAESFGQDLFVARLSQEIATAHSMSMDRGLSIMLNRIPLRHDPLQLLSSEVIQPAFMELNFDSFGPKPVHVKLYAGLSGRSKEEGGWYVFCNGRLVLRADQSNLTVWGEGDRVPKYHPDFARFRGLAYFDSDDSSLLPWTTTKTGVDMDSSVYRAARQQMIEMTRPVLDFLRKLEDERKRFEVGDSPENLLANAVSSAQPVAVAQVSQCPIFVAPTPPPLPLGPRMARIQYSKPVSVVDKAKKLLRVGTLKDVGEKTFDYFIKYEGGEDAE